MAVIERFDRGMIERYLRGVQLTYAQDSDGDFIVKFGYDEVVGGELVLLFAANGVTRNVYTITVISSRTMPRNEWGRVVANCNEWNEEKRWPKAYLHVQSAVGDMFGSVILEEHIDLGPCVHWELFDNWTTVVIATSFEFWRWAHQERGM